MPADSQDPTKKASCAVCSSGQGNKLCTELSPCRTESTNATKSGTSILNSSVPCSHHAFTLHCPWLSLNRHLTGVHKRFAVTSAVDFLRLQLHAEPNVSQNSGSSRMFTSSYATMPSCLCFTCCYILSSSHIFECLFLPSHFHGWIPKH